MAEIQYGEAGLGSPAARGVNLPGLISWLGGLISVSLIAGLVFWGYQLMVRDVSGVPVVRALEGPMRITPVDPGGSNAQHQGLAVNNIAAVGEAEAPADRLVLAPKPTALGAADPTAAQLSEMAGPVEITPAPDAQVAVAVEQTSVADQASVIEATLRLVEDQAATPAIGNPAPDAATTGTQTISASISGVSKSLRPLLRPATLIVTPVAAQLAAAPDGVRTVDHAAIPVGTRLAQLGAFESEDMARAEWIKISAKFDDFMGDKSRVIEPAQSGGKKFYRLRAHGFDDLSEARRFCSALLAGQANCIPVVTR